MKFRIEIISDGHVYAGEGMDLDDALMAATECFQAEAPFDEKNAKDLSFALFMLQQTAKSLPDDHFGEIPPEMLAEIKQDFATQASKAATGERQNPRKGT